MLTFKMLGITSRISNYRYIDFNCVKNKQKSVKGNA